MAALTSSRAARKRSRVSWRALPIGGLAAGVAVLLAYCPNPNTAAVGLRFGADDIATPEGVAATVRKAGAKALKLAGAASRPMRNSLARAEAAVLCPLGRHLASVSQPGPAQAQRSLRKACGVLQVTFECPTLFVLPLEYKSKIQTLPLDKWGSTFGIFASGGLVGKAKPLELAALLAREVALLACRLPSPPQNWIVVQALRPQRNARSPRRTSQVEQSANTNWVDGLTNVAARQAVQVARVHYGVRFMDQRAHELPAELEAAWRSLSAHYRHNVPTLLGDAADVAALWHSKSWGPAAAASAQAVNGIVSRQQIGTILRIGLLYHDLYPNDKYDFSPKAMRATMNNVRLTYRVGPARVQRALSILTKLRRPWSWLSPKVEDHPSKITSWTDAVPWQSLMVASSAARRALELAADRASAMVQGDINPVIGGLVLLHGTPEERRRLARGELDGLVLDAQAEETQPKRWATWWSSVVSAKSQPPLRLRIAELAEWADTVEGRRKLDKSTPDQAASWWSWILALPRRLVELFPWFR